MADMRDDFIVLIGTDRDDLRTQLAPERDDGFDGTRIGFCQRSDEARALGK